ncbi:MAG: glycogen-binding domain-containing protein [Victivallaceae bacterium]|nr:glycogen-binding domain-containing protein [Victivallaceae bacterium]
MARPRSAKKSPKVVESKRIPSTKRHPQDFIYRGEAGHEVFVAGSFNNWDPTAKKLEYKEAKGYYLGRLMMESGRYSYKLVIDGQWILDPENDNLEPNEFGSMNNILVIED